MVDIVKLDGKVSLQYMECEKMNLSKIHHIAIIVSDYEVAKDFYVNKLGFSAIRENYRPERKDWIFVSMNIQSWRFSLRKILRSV